MANDTVRCIKVDIDKDSVDIEELMRYDYVAVIDGKVGGGLVGSFRPKMEAFEGSKRVIKRYEATDVLRFFNYLRDAALSQRTALGIA